MFAVSSFLALLALICTTLVHETQQLSVHPSEPYAYRRRAVLTAFAEYKGESIVDAATLMLRPVAPGACTLMT